MENGNLNNGSRTIEFMGSDMNEKDCKIWIGWIQNENFIIP